MSTAVRKIPPPPPFDLFETDFLSGKEEKVVSNQMKCIVLRLPKSPINTGQSWHEKSEHFI